MRARNVSSSQRRRLAVSKLFADRTQCVAAPLASATGVPTKNTTPCTPRFLVLRAVPAFSRAHQPFVSRSRMNASYADSAHTQDIRADE